MLEDLCQNYSCHLADKAVHYKETVLSYGQLDGYLNQCSTSLTYDAYSDTVLIIMNKGIELVLSTLSVFLSKHIFCILDVNTTAEGLLGILRETKANTVFTDAKQLKKLKAIGSASGVHLVEFHFDQSSLGLSVRGYGDVPPAAPATRNEDISHIIYTSGSTAAPKGILCSRKAMWSFIKWEYEYLRPPSNVNVSQMSAPWFEPFLRDLFLPLYCGGCVCIPSKREEFDPKAFAAFIREKEIDVVHIVPTMFRYLFLSPLMTEHSVRHILLAGEMLYGTDVDKYYSKFSFGTLYNLYGPSETTLAKFCRKLTKEDKDAFRVNVGRPLPGATFRLAGEHGEQISESGPGEVIISTKHGSYGYCNREATAKSFAFLKDGTTVFRTGDIGRVTEDGNLELLGRRDYMRKIYGQKVYPEEIESAVNQYAKVKKSMVVIEENKIAALLEIQDGFSIEEFTQTVNRTLIPYKRPHSVYVVEKIAVNKSGKLDRTRVRSISDIAYIKKFMI